ncbi:MAG: hypothetical protein ACR2OZ_18490 [Verrucomicrobiales bacterium]
MTSLLAGANEESPRTPDQKLAKSKIALVATVLRIEVSGEEVITPSQGPLVTLLHCSARLRVDKIVKRDQENRAEQLKVVSIRFRRVGDTRFEGDQIPTINIGDRVKVFLSHNTLVAGEAEEYVRSGNQIEIVEVFKKGGSS